MVCGGAKANSNYTPTINITREDYEAFKVAIGIMRKYQEIQEIVTEWQKQNDPKIKFVASNCNMTKIAEVLDGNILDNVSPAEAIPKADYESRLKADMAAMMKKLQLEIEKTAKEEELIDKKWAKGLHYSEKIIQRKIRELEKINEKTKSSDEP